MDKSDLNSGHYVEAIDRCYSMLEIFDVMINQHQVFHLEKELSDKADYIVSLMSDLYQATANKADEFEDGE